MNVPFNNLAPLPLVLEHPRGDGLGRRHHVLDHELNRDALRNFNQLLEYLDRPQAPLDTDQIASAVRELVDSADNGTVPRCIQQRMCRAAAIDMMAEDPDWEVAYAAAIRAELIVFDYLHDSLDLIPKAAPVIGRLDDAILVDAAWPSLASEVRDYLEFRRLRHVEALLRGETRTHFGFTRKQYQEAALAEAEWIAHCERVDQQSYVPRDATPTFKVH